MWFVNMVLIWWFHSPQTCAGFFHKQLASWLTSLLISQSQMNLSNHKARLAKATCAGRIPFFWLHWSSRLVDCQDCHPAIPFNPLPHGWTCNPQPPKTHDLSKWYWLNCFEGTSKMHNHHLRQLCTYSRRRKKCTQHFLNNVQRSYRVDLRRPNPKAFHL